MDFYDILVIGTGTAGSYAAFRCRQEGWSVAIVDEMPFGGTCALRGCSPKKVLVGATELIEHLGHMREKNIVSGNVSFSWKDLINFKRTFTDPFPKIREKSYMDAGIDVFHGNASFISANSVSINDQEITAKRIFLATGSMPSPMSMEGAEHIVTSENFLEFDDLPEKLIFVGGGFVSFELAHIARRMGSDATILHRNSSLFPMFDKAITDTLLDETRKMGIHVHLNSLVEKVTYEKGAYHVHCRTDSEPSSFSGDCVVHGAGRVPNITSLALENANVAYSEKGIEVNKFLQSTTNPIVYAGGDCVKGYPMLRWVAERHGNIAAKNMIEGNSTEVGHAVIPTVLFTIPQVSSVGMTQEQADEQGLDVIVKEVDFSQWFSIRYKGATRAASKIIKDKSTGRILGAHIIAPQAGNMANVLMVAISKGVTEEELESMYWAFPTPTSDIPYIV